jgi:quercetin dioxygenase-like cupin family protein
MGETKTVKVLKTRELNATAGSADYFTGEVKVTMLLKGEEPSQIQSASVTFPPGARTAWHSHPKGQLLVATAGSGLVQEWGKPVQCFEAGDAVWISPGVKHWHGASASSAMTHTAIQEAQDGKVVEWMEKVTDTEYDKTIATQ